MREKQQTVVADPRGVLSKGLAVSSEFTKLTGANSGMPLYVRNDHVTAITEGQDQEKNTRVTIVQCIHNCDLYVKETVEEVVNLLYFGPKVQ